MKPIAPALLILMASGGCQLPPPGDGAVAGVRYHLAVPATYEVREQRAREQVWGPIDGNTGVVHFRVTLDDDDRLACRAFLPAEREARRAPDHDVCATLRGR